MTIIKSKYNSKELYSLYEEESSKTRYGLEMSIDGSLYMIGIMCFSVPTVFILYTLLTGHNIAKEYLPIKIIGFLAIFIGCVFIFIRNKIFTAIVNHYKSKGVQFESPLDGIYSYIRLIECGELVQAAQYKSIELQPAVDGHTLYFLAKNPNTGILELYGDTKYGDTKIDIFDHALNRVIPEPGVCDFSIYDSEIEERLAKIQK